jgi:hypothetical protein
MLRMNITYPGWRDADHPDSPNRTFIRASAARAWMDFTQLS